MVRFRVGRTGCGGREGSVVCVAPPAKAQVGNVEQSETSYFSHSALCSSVQTPEGLPLYHLTHSRSHLCCTVGPD